MTIAFVVTLILMEVGRLIWSAYEFRIGLPKRIFERLVMKSFKENRCAICHGALDREDDEFARDDPPEIWQ
jgi:hypothetical protein